MRSRRSFYICCKAERGSSGGQLLHGAALKLCGELETGDACSRGYVTAFAESLLPRLDAALWAGDVSNIFIAAKGEKTGSEEEQRLRTRRRRWGVSVWDMCLVYKSGGFGAELQFFIIPVPDKDSVQLAGIIWLCNLPRPR